MSEQSRRPAEVPRTVEARVAGFAAGEVDDPLVPLSTRIPRSLRKRTRIAALEDNLDVQDVVGIALTEWHNRRESSR